MTRHLLFRNWEDGDRGALLVDAARCWRDARDCGRDVQPCLFRLLDPRGCDVLAPVLDSFLTLCEAALQRPFIAGSSPILSEDEHLLLTLLDGSRSRTCMPCPGDIATAFECAVCSTRIMIALALPPARRGGTRA